MGRIVSGVNLSNFSWRDGPAFSSPPSSLSFAGVAFSGETDDVFSFGTLSYFNGTVADGTQANSVDLDVSLSFTTPAGVNKDFIYNLQLINTVDTSNPNDSADFVYFPNSVPDDFFSSRGTNYTSRF